MKQYTLTIMDNSTANFRLTFTCLFERTINDKTINAVWHNTNQDQDGNSKDAYSFKPSCFLNFTFVSPEDYSQTKTLPTALPHIYKIRRAFQAMYDITMDPNALIEDNGNLLVNQAVNTNVVIDGINLAKGDWISLDYTVLKNDYTGQLEPGVILTTSRNNGYGSTLSLDEFYTLYDVIMHLDYVTLQHQAINIYFAEKGKAAGGSTTSAKGGYNKPAAPANYSRQSTGYTPRQASGYQPAAPATPAYQKPAAQPSASAKAAAIPTTQVRTAPTQTNNNPLPSRPATAQTPSKPKINLADMESQPVDVEDINLDENEEINNIFAGLNNE